MRGWVQTLGSAMVDGFGLERGSDSSSSKDYSDDVNVGLFDLSSEDPSYRREGKDKDDMIRLIGKRSVIRILSSVIDWSFKFKFTSTQLTKLTGMYISHHQIQISFWISVPVLGRTSLQDPFLSFPSPSLKGQYFNISNPSLAGWIVNCELWLYSESDSRVPGLRISIKPHDSESWPTENCPLPLALRSSRFSDSISICSFRLRSRLFSRLQLVLLSSAVSLSED